MITGINDFKNVFFIGVAGTGMSAIAQYLSGIGKQVSGSDRFFTPDTYHETKDKLKLEGIHCFLQNGEGITEKTELVVVSTAVENTVFEVEAVAEVEVIVSEDDETVEPLVVGAETLPL
jgi:UDP-N-acetylmuramate--alanine ligase